MTDPRPPAPVFRASIDRSGVSFAAPAWQPLLRAAADAGVELPASCRNGTCRTCICRPLAGEVGYQIEWPGVLPEEKAQGFILPCVAFARSDVVLQFESLPWLGGHGIAAL
jgi:ferredoxin